MAMTLIDEAETAGARQSKACAVLGITCRTLRRWRSMKGLVDRRKGAPAGPAEQVKIVVASIMHSSEMYFA